LILVNIIELNCWIDLFGGGAVRPQGLGDVNRGIIENPPGPTTSIAAADTIGRHAAPVRTDVIDPENPGAPLFDQGCRAIARCTSSRARWQELL